MNRTFWFSYLLSFLKVNSAEILNWRIYHHIILNYWYVWNIAVLTLPLIKYFFIYKILEYGVIKSSGANIFVYPTSKTNLYHDRSKRNNSAWRKPWGTGSKHYLSLTAKNETHKKIQIMANFILRLHSSTFPPNLCARNPPF